MHRKCIFWVSAAIIFGFGLIIWNIILDNLIRNIAVGYAVFFFAVYAGWYGVENYIEKNFSDESKKEKLLQLKISLINSMVALASVGLGFIGIMWTLSNRK